MRNMRHSRDGCGDVGRWRDGLLLDPSTGARTQRITACSDAHTGEAEVAGRPADAAGTGVAGESGSPLGSTTTARQMAKESCQREDLLYDALVSKAKTPILHGLLCFPNAL